MENLVKNVFEKCRSENRVAFVAYITAGDPDFNTSLEVIKAVVDGGADILELGVPFTDPMADGKANQLAAERALESGITPAKVLELAGEIRKLYPQLPLVLFTYLNPIAYSGDFSEFCRKAAQAGITSILPLDLPPEESEDYRDKIDRAGLSVVSLVAPTTPDKRIKLLAENANAFIYYVCREGVTGERDSFASGVNEKITKIKNYTKLPVVVGFGISTPEQVKEAAATGVDGVVVGSAIVRKVEALSNQQGDIEEIKDFVTSLTTVL